MEQKLLLNEMKCASCVNKVDTTLRKIDGIQNVRVNLLTQEARFDLDAEGTPELQQKVTAQAIAQLEALGYKAQVKSEVKASTARELAEARVRDEKWRAIFALGLTIPMLIPMLWSAWPMPSPEMQLVLTSLVMVGVGTSFARRAIASLRHFSFTMDVLVFLGTTAAFAYSVYRWQIHKGHHTHLFFESAAAILAFVQLGKWMEAVAKRRAGSALESLKRLQPEVVRVKTPKGIIERALEALQPGHLLVTRSGERIACDGVVAEGAASVDESSMTGESAPRWVRAGDTVYGGSLVLDSELVTRVSHAADRGLLAQMLEALESAQAKKDQIAKLVDRWSAVFVPLILVIAALVAIGYGAMTGDWSEGLIRAIAILVIACPCALGLATPTAVMVALGEAAKRGFVVRDPGIFETAPKLHQAAFDKTGTLTRGEPRLRDTSLDDSDLAAAASLQTSSTHPLALALLASAKSKSLSLPTAEDVRVIAGSGIEGRVSGRHLALGSERWMRELDLQPEADASLTGTLSFLADLEQKKILGHLRFVDELRPESPGLIQALRAQGVKVALLSGDRHAEVARIARELQIEQAHGEMKPQDKVAWIQAAQARGEHVAMLGDGINDSAALAQADLGVAVSGATDIAGQAAAVVLLNPDPRSLLRVILLARATHRKLWQNLAWAFGYNLIAVPMAAMGQLTPTLAAFAMGFSSVSVVVSSLLLIWSLRRAEAKAGLVNEIKTPQTQAAPAWGTR